MQQESSNVAIPDASDHFLTGHIMGSLDVINRLRPTYYLSQVHGCILCDEDGFIRGVFKHEMTFAEGYVAAYYEVEA